MCRSVLDMLVAAVSVCEDPIEPLYATSALVPLSGLSSQVSLSNCSTVNLGAKVLVLLLKLVGIVSYFNSCGYLYSLGSIHLV